MRHEFRLPDIGEGMSEGTLLDWIVSIGQTVGEGDTVAEVSTDKVDFEVPSPVAGTVLELPWEPGDVVPVGEVLMVLETEEAVAQTDETSTPPAPTAPAPPDSPAAVPTPQPIVASPVIRRRAAERGIDLSRIEGSGPGGRILEQDLQSAQTARQEPQSEGRTGGGEGSRVVELTGVRAVAARRMAESARNAATSTTTFKVRADALLALVDGASVTGLRITPLPVILRSVAEVLTRHDRLNATVEPGADSLRVYESVSLSVAMATEDGLMVPVIRRVETLSVADISRALQDLSERARTRRLAPDDVAGGSFTVSSTGGLEAADIVSTFPIINPPQTGTLWVSRISDQPAVVDGVILAVPTLTASLSFDHRFVDGADATAFINDLTHVLEAGDVPI